MSECQFCGKQYSGEGAFCPHCGEPVDSSSAPTKLPGAGKEQGGQGSGATFESGSRFHPARPGEYRFIPGTILANRYRIVGLLGKGGMGEVYRADDLKLGQTVALKFLPAYLQDDEGRLRRLLEEVRIARQVSHPNVCTVYDIGDVEGQHFLTMEYVDGEDLATLNRRIGRMPQEKAVQIARQLCAGLAAAHNQGILHRDLKPANVMIDGKGGVRITDFGLAALAGEIAPGDVLAGTPSYMAPEQLAGKEVTVKSDVFALGLVLYELFTGKQAYKIKRVSDLARIHDSPPDSPSEIVTDLDPVVERVVLRCLEKDVERRPASALAVAASLPGGDPLSEALAAGETPSPEMVAAAGESEGIRPVAAISILIVLLVLFPALLFLNQKTLLLDRVPMEKRPEVLEVDAREFISRLGHENQRYSVYGFQTDFELLRWVGRNSQTPTRWDRLDDAFPPPVYFWYRESPEPLTPANYVGWVNETDPGTDKPAMTSLRLDPAGRLLEFLRVPPEHDESQRVKVPFDYTPLFELAGLDSSDFDPVDSSWNPPIACDDRAAWVRETGNENGIPLRIEAGSYRGKAVFFKVIAPKVYPEGGSSPRSSLRRRLTMIAALSLAAIVLFAAIVLARRNLRLGRGDHKGAMRLAVYVFIVYLAFWALRVDHVFGSAEIDLALWAVERALFVALLIWILYAALEPYVRKVWPHALVSWSRLLRGRLTDPLIGRDILCGALMGSLLVLIMALSNLAPAWLGMPAVRPTSAGIESLQGTRQAFSLMLSSQTATLSGPLVVMLVIVLFRAFVRRPTVAIMITAFLFIAVGLLGSPNPMVGGARIAISWILIIFVITRFGLLASILMFYFANLAALYPLTAKISAWYADRTFIILGLMVVLVLYGFWISLGSRVVFKDLLAD